MAGIEGAMHHFVSALPPPLPPGPGPSANFCDLQYNFPIEPADYIIRVNPAEYADVCRVSVYILKFLV